MILALLLLLAQDHVSGLSNQHPAQITEADVDRAMWPIVERINRSGWVWTTESCQGHEGRGPLLGLVTDDPGRVFRLLSEAHREMSPDPQVGTQDPEGLRLTVQFYTQPVVSLGRYQVRLTTERSGLVWFAAFAELVTP